MALGNLISIAIPNIASDIATFTTLRIYRCTSQTSTTTLINSPTLVAGTTQYQYQDTSGLLTSWYTWNLFDGGSNTTTDAERFPAVNAPAWDRATLRQLVADRLGLYGKPKRGLAMPAVSGTTTGAGSSTTAVDSTYISGRWETNAFRDWYLLATSSTESGNERLITSFTAASGTFTTDAFATGIGSGATIEIYGMRPSTWWTERVNDGLWDLWVPVRSPLDGITSQTEYALPWYFEDPEQILGLTYRTGDTIRQGRFYGGRDLVLKPLDGGGVFAYLEDSIAANSVYFLEGYRHPSKLISDTDVVILSEQNKNILVITAAMRAAQRIAQEQVGGSTENRAIWERKWLQLEDERKAINAETGDWKRLRSPRQTSMVDVGYGGGNPSRAARSSQYY